MIKFNVKDLDKEDLERLFIKLKKDPFKTGVLIADYKIPPQDAINNSVISLIKKIQNGDWNREEKIDGLPIPRIARNLWNDDKFAYGMEIGAIIILMEYFNLKKCDL